MFNPLHLNCSNCQNKYQTIDELCDNEIVCFCDIDNHYIGFPDDINDENICIYYKKEGE